MKIYQNLGSFIDSLSTGELVVIMPSGTNQVDNYCTENKLSAPHLPRFMGMAWDQYKALKASYINEVNELGTEFRRYLLTNVSQEDNEALEDAFTDCLDSFIPELQEVA